ncbi:MAG: asparaginase [Bacteroidetes bacterium]|nr:MAG: asparaginase [Bacteroidota bacterium]
MNCNPILVEVLRGDVLESFHRGVVCIVDQDEKLRYSAGDIEQVCYPRSALKFFQQIPLLTSGAADALGLSEEEIAITCGSHNGEDMHVKAVDSILRKAGLDRSALKCGAQYPTHRKTANALLVAGQKPEAIHNNCSGKHAGFLAYCVFRGWDTVDYINPQHPLQLEIRKLVSAFHKYPEAKLHTALDGCSAPIFSIPVYNQALGYMYLAKFAKEDSELGKACKRLIDAAGAYPMMIAGTGRYCSDLMAQSGSRIIGKTGAEGIYSLAFTEEVMGACIKVDDGKMLPQYNVAQKLVRQSGILSEAQLTPLDAYEESAITNFNKFETGTLRVNPEILSTPWL